MCANTAGIDWLKNRYADVRKLSAYLIGVLLQMISFHQHFVDTITMCVMFHPFFSTLARHAPIGRQLFHG
jgi:hypothetical protein